MQHLLQQFKEQTRGHLFAHNLEGYAQNNIHSSVSNLFIYIKKKKPPLQMQKCLLVFACFLANSLGLKVMSQIKTSRRTRIGFFFFFSVQSLTLVGVQ